MDYSHFAILFLLLSLALLVAEVFLPSGGILSVFTIIALAGSVMCAYRAWWQTSPALWWSYLAGVAFLLPSVLIAAFTIFPRTAYGRRMLLEAPSQEEVIPYSRDQAELHALIGKRGTTVTLHNPGGMVVVDGQRRHSETRGMLVEPGVEIEVLAVKANRLVVRLAAHVLTDANIQPGAVDDQPRATLPPPTARSATAFDPFAEESSGYPA